MANFYYDCEFLEGKQDKRFLGIKYGETKNTIDLISIGIVSEDNQEYYAISKDFNLKEAWNRYSLEIQSGDMRNIFPEGRKVYWIRENVLKPIFKELLNPIMDSKDNNYRAFNFKNFRVLINKYGKTNKQIAEDIKFFIADGNNNWELNPADYHSQINKNNEAVFFQGTNLYGYYSAYDHICFAWLFGKMIDLPNGFPMYTRDLKQIFDEKQKQWTWLSEKERMEKCYELNLFSTEIDLKHLSNYPKQQNEHSSIHDARWNKQLYEFLKSI